jgi:RNA polymerase sigma factor (sigma-70 family)
MTETGARFETFEAFHASERPRLLRLAHLLTGSTTTGEEIVQDALISVHDRWASIDEPSVYARRAIINLAHSSQRRAMRERRFLTRRRVVEVTGEPRIDETWAVVRSLRSDQRTIVVLRFYADYSLNQIAEELSLPLGTVKSTLHRALKQLKETLDV